MSAVSTTEHPVVVRALAPQDLTTVVAIDAAIEGRARRLYVERRLAAAVREPTLHAQFAACRGDELVGYILARVLHGEFGRAQPGLRLEMVGVSPTVRGLGAGHKLFDALALWASRHGIAEFRTAARWNDTAMVRWLDGMGFSMAPSLILGCEVANREPEAETESEIVASNGQGPGHEIDFGMPQANDHERQAMDLPQVRAMTQNDLRQIVRIDHDITERDRSAYITAKLGEAMDDGAIRVSLTACRDGAIVGYLMARADLGDFGRTAPVAIIDTIGVAPAYAGKGIGRALLRQLSRQSGRPVRGQASRLSCPLTTSSCWVSSSPSVFGPHNACPSCAYWTPRHDGTGRRRGSARGTAHGGRPGSGHEHRRTRPGLRN